MNFLILMFLSIVLSYLRQTNLLAGKQDECLSMFVASGNLPANIATSLQEYRIFVETWQEEFEDTKGVIRSCKSKNYRQRNGQKKKDKRANNDLQTTTLKTKD
jgi:hypothetical protein